MVMAPPPMHDSGVSPCFHGCLTFLHGHFPPQSPPSHLLDPSPHSQQQTMPWDYSPVPMVQLQLPCVPGHLHPCPGYVGLWQVLSVCFSFHSDCHRSAAALAATQGSDPCFSSSTSQVQGQSCSLSPFSFLSFALLSFAWIHTFLSYCQELLPALNWCSVTFSV